MVKGKNVIIGSLKNGKNLIKEYAHKPFLEFKVKLCVILPTYTIKDEKENNLQSKQAQLPK